MQHARTGAEQVLERRAGPAPLELVWADEFDGPGINTTSWSFMLGDGSQYGLPGEQRSSPRFAEPMP